MHLKPAPHRQERGGFSLVELTIVLLLGGLALGFASVAFNRYLHRVSAQGAAQVFAQDLALARSAALRAREPVVIRFYEDTRWYAVTLQQTETEVVRRRLGANGDIALSAVDLYMKGDTVLFSARGVASMKNAFGSVGEARFSSGEIRYRVFFNAMGASKVEES